MVSSEDRTPRAVIRALVGQDANSSSTSRQTGIESQASKRTRGSSESAPQSGRKRRFTGFDVQTVHATPRALIRGLTGQTSSENISNEPSKPERNMPRNVQERNTPRTLIQNVVNTSAAAQVLLRSRASLARNAAAKKQKRTETTIIQNLSEDADGEDNSEFFATTKASASEAGMTPSENTAIEKVVLESHTLKKNIVENESDDERQEGEEEEEEEDPFAMMASQPSLYQRKPTHEQTPATRNSPAPSNAASTPSLESISASTPSNAVTIRANTPGVLWDDGDQDDDENKEDEQDIRKAVIVNERRRKPTSMQNDAAIFDPPNTPLVRASQTIESPAETPSILPMTTLLNGSVLAARVKAKKKKVPPVPLFDATNTSSIKRGRENNKKRTKPPKNIMPRAKNAPHLSDHLVKRLWTNMLRTSALGGSSADSNTVQAVQDATQEYFQLVANDLAAFADYRKSTSVRIQDAQMLLQSHGITQTNGEKDIRMVILKSLPREYANQLFEKIG